MATSNINDPFVLASYKTSARGKSATKYTPGVHASAHQGSNSSDGYVTVAAQADGVHIIDVANSHPLISYTLGPSTSFSCPPVTLSSTSKHSYTTYVVINASPELPTAEDAGRTLWVWETDTSSRERQKGKRSQTILPQGQSVHGLYLCPELPRRLISLSTTGDISIVDAESLEVRSTSTSSTTPSSSSSKQPSVLHAWTFSRSSSPLGDTQNGVIVLVLVSGNLNTTHLRTFAVDEGDAVIQKAEDDLPVLSEKIIAASCSGSGVLSVLTSDGVWTAYQLEPFSTTSPSKPLEQLSSPVHLSNFTFLPSPSHTNLNTLAVSLLALTSSHVLLAAISPQQDIIIHIWDLQFSVLLFSLTLPVPSALTSTALHLRLVPGAEKSSKKQGLVLGQAVLIASSVPPPPVIIGKEIEKDTIEQKSASVLFVVPYAVPAASTIAAAMGRGNASMNWLKPVSGSGAAGATEQSESAEEKPRAKMLTTLRAAIQGGRPQAAEAAFMQWAPKSEEENSSPSTLDYNFVKELLELVLIPSSDSQTAAAKLAYASEVVRYLLDRRLVCSAMVASPGGLLGALRARGDWKSIELAFDRVLDLTEIEIVETLRFVIAHHRLSSSNTATSADQTSNAMQVDPPTSAPAKNNNDNPTTSLPFYLNLFVAYPTSRGPLLVALRRYLQDAEDVTAVLRVLEGWVARRTKLDERLMPSKKELKKTEQGVWVVAGKKSERERGGGDVGQTKPIKRDDVPVLEKTTTLLQILLDAAFLSLIPHKPAHKILRSLSEHLGPEIAFARVVEGLRGPLEAFAIAQEKAVKESLISPQEREKEKQKGDWRQRKKGAAGAEVGVYALEELVL